MSVQEVQKERKKMNLNHVRLFWGAIDPDFVLMDYARTHRNLAVEE